MPIKLLITGGAGFIGSNLSHYFAGKNFHVTIYDNLSRFGAKDNIQWLKKDHPQINIIVDDIRNFSELKNAVKNKDVVFHLAGQVAVTTSVANPRLDFEANALGTLNVLEAVRLSGQKPAVFYASTNKVYGGMENLKIIEKNGRYAYKDLPFGINESTCLDFHSPYGCSKGVGDQYVRDYERIFDIPTVVFRQSCIYGPRQFGIEDQGWIAWFIIALLHDKKLHIYGDGKQVRDILFIDDLVRAYEIALSSINKVRGRIYNIGGGINKSISIWSEFRPILESLFNKKIDATFSSWRPGDQKVYISDIRLAKKDLNWEPRIDNITGITRLYHWAKENKELFKKLI